MNAPPPGPDRAGARHRRRRPGPRRSGGEGRGRFAKHHAQNKPALHEAPAAAILRPLSGPRFGCQGARGRAPASFGPRPRWGVAGPAPLSPEGRPRRSTGRAVRTAAPGGGTDMPPPDAPPFPTWVRHRYRITPLDGEGGESIGGGSGGGDKFWGRGAINRLRGLRLPCPTLGSSLPDVIGQSSSLGRRRTKRGRSW